MEIRKKSDDSSNTGQLRSIVDRMEVSDSSLQVLSHKREGDGSIAVVGSTLSAISLTRRVCGVAQQWIRRAVCR